MKIKLHQICWEEYIMWHSIYMYYFWFLSVKNLELVLNNFLHYIIPFKSQYWGLAERIYDSKYVLLTVIELKRNSQKCNRQPCKKSYHPMEKKNQKMFKT